MIFIIIFSSLSLSTPSLHFNSFHGNIKWGEMFAGVIIAPFWTFTLDKLNAKAPLPDGAVNSAIVGKNKLHINLIIFTIWNFEQPHNLQPFTNFSAKPSTFSQHIMVARSICAFKYRIWKRECLHWISMLLELREKCIYVFEKLSKSLMFKPEGLWRWYGHCSLCCITLQPANGT